MLTLTTTGPIWSEDGLWGERIRAAQYTMSRKRGGGVLRWSGRVGKGCPGWSHSLPLHLLLLLEDLVGLHRQPLLHQKLLPLQLALPHLCQPFALCHEQLPALMGRKEAPCSVPWGTWASTATALEAKMRVVLSSPWPQCQTLWFLQSLTQLLSWLGRHPPPLLCQSFIAEPLALPRSVGQKSGLRAAGPGGQVSWGPHQPILDLQLQLRRRWSGCGYSSVCSQPVGTRGRSAEA